MQTLCRLYADSMQTLCRLYADSIRNGWVGRQLPRLFTEQRLEVRSLDSVQVFRRYAMAELAFGSHLAFLQTNGVLSAARAQQWWEYLRQADAMGKLLISFTSFIVAGAKPGADG